MAVVFRGGSRPCGSTHHAPRPPSPRRTTPGRYVGAAQAETGRRPLPDFRDVQLRIASRGRHQLRALRGPRPAALMRRRTNRRCQLSLDQLLQHPRKRGADLLGHLSGVNGSEKLGQVRIGVGHRRGTPLRESWQEHAKTHAGDLPTGGSLSPSTPRQGTPTAVKEAESHGRRIADPVVTGQPDDPVVGSFRLVAGTRRGAMQRCRG